MFANQKPFYVNNVTTWIQYLSTFWMIRCYGGRIGLSRSGHLVSPNLFVGYYILYCGSILSNGQARSHRGPWWRCSDWWFQHHHPSEHQWVSPPGPWQTCHGPVLWQDRRWHTPCWKPFEIATLSTPFNPTKHDRVLSVPSSLSSHRFLLMIW